MACSAREVERRDPRPWMIFASATWPSARMKKRIVSFPFQPSRASSGMSQWSLIRGPSPRRRDPPVVPGRVERERSGVDEAAVGVGEPGPSRPLPPAVASRGLADRLVEARQLAARGSAGPRLGPGRDRRVGAGAAPDRRSSVFRSRFPAQLAAARRAMESRSSAVAGAGWAPLRPGSRPSIPGRGSMNGVEDLGRERSPPPPAGPCRSGPSGAGSRAPVLGPL